MTSPDTKYEYSPPMALGQELLQMLTGGGQANLHPNNVAHMLGRESRFRQLKVFQYVKLKWP
jgi:hypothetical protein